VLIASVALRILSSIMRHLHFQAATSE